MASSGKYLIAENGVMKAFYRNLSAMIVKNVYLIKKYGVNGVAGATLISWVVLGHLYDLFDKDLRFMFVQKPRHD